MPNEKAMEWKVNHLRLTTFATAPINITNLSWWDKIVGTPADQRIIKPKDIQFLEQGSLENGELIFSVDIDRSECRYAAKPQEDEEFRIPVIGTIPDALTTFLKICTSWLKDETMPPLRRIAFGAILIIDVKSRDEGYQTLNNFLKSTKIDTERTSDFLLQINKKRPSQKSSQDIYINRLMKWSVQLQSHQLLRLSPPVGSATESIKKEALGCRLELDINTPADFQGELLKTELDSVFMELIELGKEIAAEGEIN